MEHAGIGLCSLVAYRQLPYCASIILADGSYLDDVRGIVSSGLGYTIYCELKWPCF